MTTLRTKGFTIVELLIVIVVLVILVTVATVTYRGTVQRSVNTQLMSDITEAADRVELEYLDDRKYPDSASEVNNGQGFKTSEGTELSYITSTDNQWFCLEASSSQSGTKNYYLAQDGKPLEGVCPTPPDPEVIPDACAEISGIQPEGTDCTPPSTDACPDIAGDQPEGTDCTPPPSEPPVTPSTPNTPATPTVSVATSGSTTTWSWTAAVCNIGTPLYQYVYSTSSATGPTTDTVNRSVAFNTATQGYTYTVKVHARCDNGSNVSGWSVYSSKSYARPVTDTFQIAGGSNSLYVPDKTRNEINGRATVTGYSGGCASGTRGIARYRTSLSQAAWVDRGGYVNYANGWTVYYPYDLDNGHMLEFSFFARCYNPTTGVQGPATYSDAYGNMHVTQNRYKPTRGTWARGCEGHNSNPTQAGWCTSDSGTFAAFP